MRRNRSSNFAETFDSIVELVDVQSSVSCRSNRMDVTMHMAEIYFVLAILAAIPSAAGAKSSKCESLFLSHEKSNLIPGKNHALYLTRGPNPVWKESYIYEDIQPSDKDALLLFPDEQNPRLVSLATIDRSSIMIFDSPAALVRYKTRIFKNGQRISFESYQTAQEIEDMHKVQRLIHGDQYLGDSQSWRSRAPRRLLKRSGVFVQQQSHQGGFIFLPDPGTSTSSELLITFASVASPSLLYLGR